jgi:hypothetical protein
MKVIYIIKNEEMLIFINELGLLIEEYKRCRNEEIKELIYDDILLLSEVIKV